MQVGFGDGMTYCKQHAWASFGVPERFWVSSWQVSGALPHSAFLLLGNAMAILAINSVVKAMHIIVFLVLCSWSSSQIKIPHCED